MQTIAGNYSRLVAHSAQKQELSAIGWWNKKHFIGFAFFVFYSLSSSSRDTHLENLNSTLNLKIAIFYKRYGF
jgi:hypothetical protein